MPEVTIDGCKVEVEKGATILDAAHKAGIWIPTLCYHPAISCEAACRICMVELDRGQWKQLVTACNYPVRKDIVVYVSSEAANKARQGVMELLLARAPESRELKQLAEKMGVTETRYPTVTQSQRNCILCGLCVRLCDELIEKSAIGFAGRGAERVVASPFHQPSEACIGCGACAVICPVGTIKIRLHEKEQELEISPFKSRTELVPCQACGKGYLPIKEFSHIQSKLGKDIKLKMICPACLRSQTVHRIEAATAVKGK